MLLVVLLQDQFQVLMAAVVEGDIIRDLAILLLMVLPQLVAVVVVNGLVVLDFKVPVLNYLQLLGLALGFSTEEMQLSAHKVKIRDTSLGGWLEGGTA